MEPAAAYIRKSLPSEGRQALSLRRQREEIAGFAKLEGYRIIKWYEEAGSGIEAEHRTVFQEMIGDVLDGRAAFRRIICCDVARFGRLGNDEAAYYRHLLRIRGVEVTYVTEDLQHDDTDDLMISAKQCLARDYSRKISEQFMRSVITLSGRAARAGRSFHMGGYPPYGYDTAYLDSRGKLYLVARRMADGSRQLLSPDGALVRTVRRGAGISGTENLRRKYVLSSPERVETVRRIFRLRAEERLSRAATARRLNQLAEEGRGPGSPTGGRWGEGTLKCILRNRAYLGHSIFNKTSRAVFYRIRRGVALPQEPWTRRGRKRNQRDDWIVVADTHEAIVDDQLFSSAQQQLKPDRAHPPPGDSVPLSRYIFAGKLQCCACGHTFVGARTHRRGSPEPWGYLCGGSSMHGRSYCRHTYVRQWALEKEVVRALARMLARLKVATDTADGRPHRREQPAPGSLEERRQARLAAELAKLEQLPRTWRSDADATFVLRKAFVLRWMAAPLVEKREILYLLVERIDFDPDTRTARVRFSDTVRNTPGATDVSETFALEKLRRGVHRPRVADLLDRDHRHV